MADAFTANPDPIAVNEMLKRLKAALDEQRNSTRKADQSYAAEWDAKRESGAIEHCARILVIISDRLKTHGLNPSASSSRTLTHYFEPEGNPFRLRVRVSDHSRDYVPNWPESSVVFDEDMTDEEAILLADRAALVAREIEAELDLEIPDPEEN